MSDNFKEEFEKNLILENIKEELEKKDKRIKELEAKELEYDLTLNEIKSKGTCGFCEHLDNQQLKEKDRRIRVLEMAFALAINYVDCREINVNCDMSCGEFPCYCKNIENYFISQAEKEIGDESKL